MLPPTNGLKRTRADRRWFFVGFAALALAIVLAGFARSFFIPVARGKFAAPAVVYVHASFFLSWVSLLIAQTTLAVSRHLSWHRRLGWLGAFLIPGMAASGVGVSLWATARDLKAGQGNTALAFLFGLFMDIAAFAALACVAFLKRHRPDTHKRLMVLATIAVLGAALGRIPVVRSVSNLVSVGLVLSVGGYDLKGRGPIHPATLWGGFALLASQFAQTPLGATSVWLSIAGDIMARVQRFQ